MDNNFFQDIRPLTKQNEQVPKPGLSTMRNLNDEELSSLRSIGELTKEPPKKSGVIWFVVLIALAVLAIVLSFFFSRADVRITAKKLHVPIEDTFVFTRGSDLSFEIMKIEDSLSEVVQGGTQSVTKVEKAKGTVTLFNEQATPQTLIATTRLESADGKIFRIENKVSIPGGSAQKPGELEVIVVADKAGPEYNVAAGTFTVPGLKGGASFDKVYAKSTKAFSGGFNGTSLSLSGDTLTQKETALQTQLESKLVSQIEMQVPEGYVYLKNAHSLTLLPLEAAPGETSDTTKVTKKGSLSVLLLPKTILDEKLKEKIILENETPVTIGEPSKLSGTIISPASIDENTQSVTLTISGDIEFTWTIDENKIRDSIIGLKKSLFDNFMVDYAEGIDKAELIIRPFWVSTVPKSPNKVKIEIQ